MIGQKKIPERMCVACRQMKPKRELVRVVRAPDLVVRVDGTGKAAGRGAYLCRNVECLERAKRIRALERTLDAQVGPDVYQALEKEISIIE